jgi:hypothetical protein
MLKHDVKDSEFLTPAVYAVKKSNKLHKHIFPKLDTEEKMGSSESKWLLDDMQLLHYIMPEPRSVLNNFTALTHFMNSYDEVVHAAVKATFKNDRQEYLVLISEINMSETFEGDTLGAKVYSFGPFASKAEMTLVMSVVELYHSVKPKYER